jgi:hypothetical protein
MEWENIGAGGLFGPITSLCRPWYEKDINDPVLIYCIRMNSV